MGQMRQALTYYTALEMVRSCRTRVIAWFDTFIARTVAAVLWAVVSWRWWAHAIVFVCWGDVVVAGGWDDIVGCVGEGEEAE